MPGPICISCGYSLAGLPRDALCPECAFPVARSLDATPLLRTADPRWLARIAAGLRALRRSMLAWFVLLILWVVSMFALLVLPSSGGWMSWLGPAAGAIMLLSLLVAVLGAALIGYGLWSLAAPTPSFHAPHAWARFTVRWLGVSFVTLLLGGTVTASVWSISSWPTPIIYSLRAAIQLAGLLFLLAISSLLAHFERSTAGPRRDLAKRTRDTRKNLIAIALLFAFGWYQTLRLGTVPAGPFGAAPALIAIGFIAFERSIRHLHKSVSAELAAANTAAIAAPPPPDAESE